MARRIRGVLGDAGGFERAIDWCHDFRKTLPDRYRQGSMVVKTNARPRRVGLVLLPHLLAASWLIFVGAAVWRHAARSAQPPIYDALTYAQKAKSVWAVLAGRRHTGLFDTEPTARPPGSVVMSYPFGFDATFHGFYFRSVFMPVVLVYLAVTLAGLKGGSAGAAPWPLLGLALGVSSMPVFFQFEYNDALPTPGYWGLVDNLTAGVSALAAAAIVRGLRVSSLAWLTVALLASGFSFFVKPAGLLTMGLVTGCFLTLSTLSLRSSRLADAERKNARRFLFRGLLLVVVIHGLVLLTAFRSAYLSADNVSFYGTAVALLQRYMSIPLTAGLFHTALHTSIGYPLLFSVLLATFLGVFRGARTGDDRHCRLLLDLAGFSVTAFVLGVLWIRQTGLTQVRYAMPSILVGIVLLVPLLLGVHRTAPTWGKAVLSSLWVLPPLSLAGLLAVPTPPLAAQRLLGVNLTSDGAGQEVRAAWHLIERLRSEDRPAVVYSLHSGSATATFECVSHWQRLIEPGQRRFTVRLPVDWKQAPSFRLQEIVTADYVLFTPVADPAARLHAVARRTLVTFEHERALFHALFTDLGEEAGVHVAWDGKCARLLRVRNAEALKRAVASLLCGYTLRAEFLAANPEFAQGPR